MKQVVYVVKVFLCIATTVASLTLNTNKVKKVIESKNGLSANRTAPVASKILWILGCSIDEHLVADGCGKAGAPITWWDKYQPGAGIGMAGFCVIGDVTMIYTFHQGGDPAPDYSGSWMGAHRMSAEDVVKTRAHQISQTFGKPPDAIIVESAYWDVASWWQNSGSPNPWPVSHEKINGWCHTAMPKFLNTIQGIIPSSHIALRSPTPTFNMHHEYMKEMNTCLVKSADNANHLLFGKYPLLDLFPSTRQCSGAFKAYKKLNTRALELHFEALKPGASEAVKAHAAQAAKHLNDFYAQDKASQEKIKVKQEKAAMAGQEKEEEEVIACAGLFRDDTHPGTLACEQGAAIALQWARGLPSA